MKKVLLFVMFAAFMGCAGRKEMIKSDTITPPVIQKVVKEEVPVPPVVAKPERKRAFKKTVYFDFDSSVVKDTINLPGVTQIVSVDGYCDYRGSEEYNYILGIQRAMAIKKILEKKGYSGMYMRSYGKSRATETTDETILSRDRKVIIICR